jgi:hypothetical protein
VSATPEMRPASHLREVVLFVLAIAGGIYAFADKVMVLGRSSASIDKIDRIESSQNQMSVDYARTKLQVELGTATSQRIEEKVDRQGAQLNELIGKLNITRRNR